MVAFQLDSLQSKLADRYITATFACWTDYACRIRGNYTWHQNKSDLILYDAEQARPHTTSCQLKVATYESPKNSWNLILPIVVSASKLGKTSPSRTPGMVTRSLLLSLSLSWKTQRRMCTNTPLYVESTLRRKCANNTRYNCAACFSFKIKPSN